MNQIKRAWKVPHDNDVARTIVADKYFKRRIMKSQVPTIRIAKNILQMSSGMPQNPVAVATIISAFVKSQTKEVIEELFSLFFSFNVHPITLSQQVISLVILAEYKTNSSANAMILYQKMVQAKMSMTDTIYKNLLLIAVKFGEDELMESVINRLTIQRDPDCPIPPGMFLAMITIITNHRRRNCLSASNHALTRLVSFQTVPQSSLVTPLPYFFNARSIPLPLCEEGRTDSLWLANRELQENSKGDLVLYDTPYISKNRISTRLSIQMIQDRLEKGHHVSLEVWKTVIRDALHCDDPEVFLTTLFGMIQRYSKRGGSVEVNMIEMKGKEEIMNIIEQESIVLIGERFDDLVKVFFMQLFASHQWRLVLFFFQVNQDNDVGRSLLFKEWLPDRVKKRDSGSIYTAFYYIFPRYRYNNDLVEEFLKAMQQCRSEKGLDALWNLITHYNGMTCRAIFWTYFSALLDLQKYDRALELVTKDSPKWFQVEQPFAYPSRLFCEAKVEYLESQMKEHWSVETLKFEDCD